ncbi:syntaxin [Cylindrobasidium torrendii FP15055 ss-10]|uniref:Syntaxin n=1 Tax=Cylindrobasidium torrendii FP15055 ss-10 TaxID=1314674 RepID=A0A0D7BT82_9AGAR|nr:syntaxin [Cylindrobasidium torrendii FP15055 ss-10]
MTAIQSVSISGFEDRKDPKPHTVYRILVTARAQPWSMWHRYSDFEELHDDLIEATGSPPPAPLPPKHRFSLFRSHADAGLLNERQTGLEAYLRAIVGAKEDIWREAYPFKQFLGVPMSKAQTEKSTAVFSSNSWLDEHSGIQTRLREVRAEINRREAFSSQGDVNASHRANVAAKKGLAGILSRIGNLGTGLQTLAKEGMSEGEVQRRTDMVARLQDECEKMSKMTSIARTTAGQAGSSTVNSASTQDREALFGQSATTRVTRVFGKPQPPQETEDTRPLDNRGLLSLQQTQIHEQDEQLDQLAVILRRQRQLGQAIGSEIAYQNELLDDVSREVDTVGGRLQSAQRDLRRLG